MSGWLSFGQRTKKKAPAPAPSPHLSSQEIAKRAAAKRKVKEKQQQDVIKAFRTSTEAFDLSELADKKANTADPAGKAGVNPAFNTLMPDNFDPRLAVVAARASDGPPEWKGEYQDYRIADRTGVAGWGDTVRYVTKAIVGTGEKIEHDTDLEALRLKLYNVTPTKVTFNPGNGKMVYLTRTMLGEGVLRIVVTTGALMSRQERVLTADWSKLAAGGVIFVCFTKGGFHPLAGANALVKSRVAVFPEKGPAIQLLTHMQMTIEVLCRYDPRAVSLFTYTRKYYENGHVLSAQRFVNRLLLLVDNKTFMNWSQTLFNFSKTTKFWIYMLVRRLPSDSATRIAGFMDAGVTDTMEQRIRLVKDVFDSLIHPSFIPTTALK